MNDHDDERRDNLEADEAYELTPSEKKELEMLPRDRIPSAALEDRVVGVLRTRGILRPPRRRVIELAAWRIAVAAAACLILLTGGFAIGRYVGARGVANGSPIENEISDISVAASLQQTGTAYLKALRRLSELPDTAGEEHAAQGREVALTTLCTAAERIIRLVPQGELAGRLSAVLNRDLAVCATSGRVDILAGGDRIIGF